MGAEFFCAGGHLLGGSSIGLYHIVQLLYGAVYLLYASSLLLAGCGYLLYQLGGVFHLGHHSQDIGIRALGGAI